MAANIKKNYLVQELIAAHAKDEELSKGIEEMEESVLEFEELKNQYESIFLSLDIQANFDPAEWYGEGRAAELGYGDEDAAERRSLAVQAKLLRGAHFRKRLEAWTRAHTIFETLQTWLPECIEEVETARRTLAALRASIVENDTSLLAEMGVKKNGDALEVLTAVLASVEGGGEISVNVRGGKSDKGIDVIATSRTGEVLQLISCKQYKTGSVNPPFIREVSGSWTLVLRDVGREGDTPELKLVTTYDRISEEQKVDAAYLRVDVILRDRVVRSLEELDSHLINNHDLLTESLAELFLPEKPGRDDEGYEFRNCPSPDWCSHCDELLGHNYCDCDYVADCY